MRRFIHQTVIFVAIAICAYSIIVISINKYSHSSFTLKKADTKILFFGNSHVMTGVNDSLISDSYNFGRNGERMEWLYGKLKLALDNNPQVEYVGIGFDNVLCYHESTGAHMQNMSPYFLGAWDLQDYLTLWQTGSLSYNFDMYTKSLNVAKLYETFREGGKGLENLTMGGFEPSDRHVLQEDIERRGKNFKIASDRTPFDPMAHHFLDKAIDYCHSKGVKVFFFCPPQHKLTHQHGNSYIQDYSNNYDTIPFLNYRTTVLDDSCFQDLDHLSREGANVFSKMLNKDLNALFTNNNDR